MSDCNCYQGRKKCNCYPNQEPQENDLFIKWVLLFAALYFLGHIVFAVFQ
jgi:hypothetical protein